MKIFKANENPKFILAHLYIQYLNFMKDKNQNFLEKVDPKKLK